MRVIIPILITAIWTLATARIDGVWPPGQAIPSVSQISQQIEAPARSLLAALSPEQQDQATPDAVQQLRRLKNPSDGQRRFALPGLPKSPRRPVCG